MTQHWIIFTSLFCIINSQKFAVFDEGRELPTVSLNSLTQTNRDQLVDPRQTGSVILDSKDPGVKSAQLSDSISVDEFRGGHRYFRVHPTFIKCLQSLIDYADNREVEVSLEVGYARETDLTSSVLVTEYLRSGSASIISVGGGDIMIVASGALAICTQIFSEIGRNLGLILLENNLVIFMSGSTDSRVHFSSESSSYTDSAFRTWVQNEINSNLDPISPEKCNINVSIQANEQYPPTHNILNVVGPIDSSINRTSSNDFLRLVQYAGTDVVFGSNTATWCGSPGTSCVDCSNGVLGYSVSTRCSERLMSPRLFECVRHLQFVVRTHLSDKLIVEKSYYEPDSSRPTLHQDTASDEDTLRLEARSSMLKLQNDNSPERLGELARYAICSGCDFIKHKGNYILVAVKKQKSISTDFVTFPSTKLLPVNLPTTSFSLYKIQSNHENQYLFDSKTLSADNLGKHIKTASIKSKDSSLRYFRASPLLVTCFEELFDNLKDEQQLSVIRAYMTSDEEDLFLGSSSDDEESREDSYSHGLAMDLNFTVNGLADTHQLATLVFGHCSPIFSGRYKSSVAVNDEWTVRVGLYPDYLHLSLDSSSVSTNGPVNIWLGKDMRQPPEYRTTREYVRVLTEQFYAGSDELYIQSSHDQVTCLSENLPKKQSPSFVHRPLHKPSNSNTTTNSTLSISEFCLQSKLVRQKRIDMLWSEMLRLQFHKNREKLRNALENCLGLCGPRRSGPTYYSKVQHCNELVHWIPFRSNNDDADSTNLYYRSTDITASRSHACYSGGKCVDQSPLFAQIAPHIEVRFRPSAESSIEQRLYSDTENPSPVLDLIERTFAMHAVGRVNVWLENQTQLRHLQSILKVVMVYNKKATEVVMHIPDSETQDVIESNLRTITRDWTFNSCSKEARSFVLWPRFQLMPTSTSASGGRKKRSLEDISVHNPRRENINWEMNWVAAVRS